MKKILKITIIFVTLAILLTGATLNSSVTASANGGVISWGLTPNKIEKTPDTPKNGAGILSENNGIFVHDTKEKKVFFTFDLGYEAGYTHEVLDTLKSHNIKAVFFLCGNYIKETDIINRMINEGHCIGNHTDRHKDLPTLSEENIKKDIVDFEVKFAEKFSAPIKFFRPPQGRFCARSLKIVNEQKLKTLMWSIAIVDWGKTPINATANAQKITDRLHSGAIILFHITNSGTPAMLKELIPKIAEKGYTVGSASELY